MALDSETTDTRPTSLAPSSRAGEAASIFSYYWIDLEKSMMPREGKVCSISVGIDNGYCKLVGTEKLFSPIAS